MSTVRERIAWILEHGTVPSTGAVWDAQSLSLASGLAPAHIGMIVRGTIDEPRRPTLEKIARASGISLMWLLSGQGEPMADDPAPVREPAPTTSGTPTATPTAEPAGEPLVERALAYAFDPRRHSLGDLRAVSDAGQERDARLAPMSTPRDRVRAILERTGWSQRELARRAGLAESHISLIVTRLGENVRPTTLRAIASAAGVSESWLLTGEGPLHVPEGTQAGRDAVSDDGANDPIRTGETDDALERALAFAFDPRRHRVADLRAVQDALQRGGHVWRSGASELVEAAQIWMSAAADLRREGVEVTALTLLEQVTFARARREASVDENTTHDVGSRVSRG